MSTFTKGPTHPVLHGVAVLALVGLLPAFAQGQSLAEPMARVASEAVAVDEADALHRTAEAMLSTYDRGQWNEAARLFEKAASLRPVESPTGIQELALSGQMFYYLGQSDRALKNLRHAAELALGNGRVMEAAQLLLKAAYVADARSQAAEAAMLVRSAKRLANSPHLTKDECDCILEGIARAMAEADTASR